MRPLRIARRVVSRARHWGTPHVHCPGCGGDASVPPDGSLQRCFVCRMDWLRVDLTGDDAADWASVLQRVDGRAPWAATWRPLMVDVPDSASGKRTDPLPCVFIYFPAGPDG